MKKIISFIPWILVFSTIIIVIPPNSTFNSFHLPKIIQKITTNYLSIVFIFVFVIGIFLYLLVKNLKNKLSPEKRNLTHQIKVVFSAFLSGKVFGLDGLAIFFLYSASLFNWIPSFLKEGKVFKSVCILLACIDGFLYLFYKALEKYIPNKKPSDIFPEKRKVLIRAISFAKREVEDRRRYLEHLLKASCENLVNNKNLPSEISNLGPLFKAIYYHAHKGPLEKVYLLVSENLAMFNPDHSKEISELNQKILKVLEEKIRNCIGKEIEINFVGKEKGIDFENYHELREVLLKILKEVQKNYDTSDITVDISGGTSVVSAALMLIAVKGHIQAQYISQRDPQILKVIDTNVLEVSDLLEELFEKFETE